MATRVTLDQYGARAISVLLTLLIASSGNSWAKPAKSNSGALVPPPPPIVVPSGFGMAFPLSTPVEYLSEDELKTTRQDVVTRLEAAHSALVEKEERNDELQKRATLFATLIEEGVVSRKELQSAEREAKSSQDELVDAQQVAKQLEDQLTRIDAQLTRLTKKKPPAAQKSKKSDKSKK